MKNIIIASKNPGKIREFKEMLIPLGFTVTSLLDLNFADEIIEDGKTFKENVLIKAKTIAMYFNQPCLADDSGIEVTALNMQPGIYSARYAGGHDDEENNKLLIKKLKGKENKEARYVCALCLFTPNKEPIFVEDYCYGQIVEDAKGSFGFGYDKHFFVPQFGLTMAQLQPEQKNSISHRAKALKKLELMLIGCEENED